MAEDWSSYNVVLDIFSMIAAIITLCLTISVYYNHYKYPDNFRNRNQKTTVSIGITFYTLSMIIMTILYNGVNSNSHKTSAAYTYGFLAHVWFWGCGVCTTYILFTLRIYTTFKSSAYHSSKYTYLSLYLSIFIWFICHIILVIIVLLQYYKVITVETKSQIHAVELAIKAITLLYASIVLTYLFVSKLMKVSLGAAETSSNISSPKSTETTTFTSSKNALDAPRTHHENVGSLSMSNVVQTAIIVNLKLNNKEINFLSAATKMTVLSSVMAISSVALIILALISTFFPETDLGAFLWHFGAMFGLMVDSVVNTFCIYMSLPYSSSRLFYKNCCKSTFHTCCLTAAKKRVQTKKMQKIEEIETQL
eukprot:208283_1